MRTEHWDCQDGLTEVRTDDSGCPIDRKYCKTQAGGSALAIATTVAWSITITLPNFTEARVRGLVLAAYSTAAGNADVLHTQTVTSITIQGDEQLGNAIVSAERYRADSTGNNVGSGQAYRGRLGTTGGSMVILGLNNALVTVNVHAALDINAVRG